MLVLSRKQNQSIVIGDNVKIQVLKISGNTVRIGVEAPDDVKILRGELAPYGIESNSNSNQTQSADSIVAGLVVDLEFEQDDMSRLPNPFAVAQAS